MCQTEHRAERPEHPAPVGGVALVFSSPMQVHADVLDAMTSFEWSAPSECPSESSVRDVIRSIARTSANRPSTRVSAIVTSSSPWTARIHIENGEEQAERRLEAASCEALGQAVALVVALAIDRAESAPRLPRTPRRRSLRRE